MPDFRVQTEFFTHPKTLRLIRHAGKIAPLHLIRLWSYATEYRADGDLGGIDDRDIERLIGAKRGFLDVLREVGFLTESMLNDWNEHQPWVVASPERSAAAKRAADARWDAERMRAAQKRNTDTHAEPMRGRNAPSPSPSPSPKKGSAVLNLLQPESEHSGKRKNGDAGFAEWWEELRPWFKLANRRLSYKADALEYWKKQGLSQYAEQIRDRTIKQRQHYADALRSGQGPPSPPDPHRYLKKQRYNDETP